MGKVLKIILIIVVIVAVVLVASALIAAAPAGGFSFGGIGKFFGSGLGKLVLGLGAQLLGSLFAPDPIQPPDLGGNIQNKFNISGDGRSGEGVPFTYNWGKSAWHPVRPMRKQADPNDSKASFHRMQFAVGPILGCARIKRSGDDIGAFDFQTGVLNITNDKYTVADQEVLFGGQAWGWANNVLMPDGTTRTTSVDRYGLFGSALGQSESNGFSYKFMSGFDLHFGNDNGLNTFSNFTVEVIGGLCVPFNLSLSDQAPAAVTEMFARQTNTALAGEVIDGFFYGSHQLHYTTDYATIFALNMILPRPFGLGVNPNRIPWDELQAAKLYYDSLPAGDTAAIEFNGKYNTDNSYFDQLGYLSREGRVGFGEVDNKFTYVVTDDIAATDEEIAALAIIDDNLIIEDKITIAYPEPEKLALQFLGRYRSEDDDYQTIELIHPQIDTPEYRERWDAGSRQIAPVNVDSFIRAEQLQNRLEIAYNYGSNTAMYELECNHKIKQSKYRVGQEVVINHTGSGIFDARGRVTYVKRTELGSYIVKVETYDTGVFRPTTQAAIPNRVTVAELGSPEALTATVVTPFASFFDQVRMLTLDTSSQNDDGTFNAMFSWMPPDTPITVAGYRIETREGTADAAGVFVVVEALTTGVTFTLSNISGSIKTLRVTPIGLQSVTGEGSTISFSPRTGLAGNAGEDAIFVDRQLTMGSNIFGDAQDNSATYAITVFIGSEEATEVQHNGYTYRWERTNAADEFELDEEFPPVFTSVNEAYDIFLTGNSGTQVDSTVILGQIPLVDINGNVIVVQPSFTGSNLPMQGQTDGVFNTGTLLTAGDPVAWSTTLSSNALTFRVNQSGLSLSALSFIAGGADAQFDTTEIFDGTSFGDLGTFPATLNTGTTYIIRYRPTGGRRWNALTAEQRNVSVRVTISGVDYDLPFDAGVGIIPASVRIQIPTETIDETISLAPGLTTNVALRDDLASKIPATISNEFPVTSIIDTDGNPVVRLTANDNTDHTPIFTFTNNSGDLTGSALTEIPPTAEPMLLDNPGRTRVFMDMNADSITGLADSVRCIVSGINE